VPRILTSALGEWSACCLGGLGLSCMMKYDVATELDHEWVPEPVAGAGVKNY